MTFHMVSATHDEHGLRLYVDGDFVGSKPGPVGTIEHWIPSGQNTDDLGVALTVRPLCNLCGPGFELGVDGCPHVDPDSPGAFLERYLRVVGL